MGKHGMAKQKLSHADAILEHLVQLARAPGWKAYAWGAAKEFESINPYDLQGMQEALKQRMTAEKAPQ